MGDLKTDAASRVGELPFSNRVTCTIAQTSAATGLGKNKYIKQSQTGGQRPSKTIIAAS
jgi:hypothetical protein